MNSKKIKPGKIVLEITLCLWIAASIYVWIALSYSGPRIATLQGASYVDKTKAVIVQSRELIRPYVWRQYVYAKKKSKESPPK